MVTLLAGWLDMEVVQKMTGRVFKEVDPAKNAGTSVERCFKAQKAQRAGVCATIIVMAVVER